VLLLSVYVVSLMSVLLSVYVVVKGMRVLF